MTKPSSSVSDRGGFTLVEVVVAIVLLSTVLVCLGGLSYHAARQAVNVGNGAGRQAVALEMVNILTALPYADIQKPSTWCDTVQLSGATNRYERCLNVTSPVDRSVTVRVAVTPLHAGSFAQSYEFVRSAPPTTNPLMMP